MPRGNINNLIPNSELTPEQRKARAEKAGKASGEARRTKKYIREALQRALNGKYEIDGQVVSGYNALALRILQEALNGSVQAFKEIRDTIEKPTDLIGIENDEIAGINITFVDKSKYSFRKEQDPKIVGDYTPPSNTDMRR